MKRIVALSAILFACFHITSAQRNSGTPNKDEIRDMRREMIRELKEESGVGRTEAAQAVTIQDVGEPDSFGKNAQFLGIAGSGAMYVYYTCDPAVLNTDLGLVLGPDDRCLAAPDPAVTATAIFTDVARITIPGKTAKDIVYMINNHSISWDFSNAGMAPLFAQMSYSPRVTIESEALNDPAAIDPNTGLPMNGSYTTTGSGTKFVNNRIQPGDFSNYADSYTRANTSGFSRSFWAALGLPNSVINNIYKKPMTIRLGARISVRGIGLGSWVYSARFLGT